MCEDGLLAVRYEGLQDVDLKYYDNQEIVIQLKDRTDTLFSWAVLKPILAGFVRNELKARHGSSDSNEEPPLSYLLVATGVPYELKVAKVLRAKPTKEMCTEVAALVEVRDRCNYKVGAVREVARRVMEMTAFELGPRSNPVRTYRALAFEKLVRLGVQTDRVEVALSRLSDLLQCGEVFEAARVYEVVGQFLSESHPFSGRGQIRVVPTWVPLDDHFAIRDNFHRGGHSWQAVAIDADAERDEAADLKAALVIQSGARLVILKGVGGSGKSTLARRAVFDLQREGKVLAMWVANGDLEESGWNELTRLIRTSGDRRLVLIVDDIFRFPAIADGLQRLDVRAPITILGTTRPGERKTAFEGLEIPEITRELQTISNQEVDRLCQKSGLDKSRISRADLAKLQATGQIFLLAAALADGSLEEFARGILAPLKKREPDLLEGYLDVCVGGRNDLLTPEPVLIRKNPSNNNIDKAALLHGLVERPGGVGDLLRSGHALLAQSVLEVQRVDVVARSVDLVKSADPNQPQERRYALKLLQNCLEKEEVGLRVHAAPIRSVLEAWEPVAHYLDLKRMVEILEVTGEVTAARAIEEKMTSDRVRTGPDAASCMYDAEREGRFGDVFPKLLEFYGEDDTSYARWKFVEKASHFASAEQKQDLLKLMHAWLQRAGFPSRETAATLNLLTGTPNKIAAGFAELVEDVLKKEVASIDLILRIMPLLRRKIQSDRVVQLVLQLAPSLMTNETPTERYRIVSGLCTVAMNAGLVCEQERWFDSLLESAVSAGEVPKMRDRYFRRCMALVPETRLAALREALQSVIASMGPNDGLEGMLRALIDVGTGASRN